MSRKVIFITLAIMAILGFSGFYYLRQNIPALTVPAGADKEQVIESIDQWLNDLNKNGDFNGAVLFAKKGKPLLAQGYGYSNAAKTKHLNKHSLFRLASLSKAFTAMGVLFLEDKGLLDVDDLVVKYIPEFPYVDVKIRHLLNHTSGIPDNYMDLGAEQKGKLARITNKIAIDLVNKAKAKAPNPPLETYRYNNTGYITAARLIEIVSGKTFENYMKSEVFEPIGMKHTRVWNLLSSEVTFENKVNDLKRTNNGFEERSPSFIDGVAGDGAVFSSLKDFITWDSFLYHNTLIKPEILVQAFESPTFLNGKKGGYGFGWNILEDGQTHDGSWLGARTYILRNTTDKSLLVLLNNTGASNLRPILSELKKVQPLLMDE